MVVSDVTASKIVGELAIDDAQGGTIEIQNDERSWEKYYAFVVGEQAAFFVISPYVGMLAPRGGANQFSDSAILKISKTGTGSNGITSGTFVVAGTEAETWIYQIRS